MLKVEAHSIVSGVQGLRVDVGVEVDSVDPQIQ